jgi:hypothetical protein
MSCCKLTTCAPIVHMKKEITQGHQYATVTQLFIKPVPIWLWFVSLAMEDSIYTTIDVEDTRNIHTLVIKTNAKLLNPRSALACQSGSREDGLKDFPYVYLKGSLLSAPTSYHYWKFRLCRVPETLGKGYQTVGNGFADGRTRHRAHGEFFLGFGSLPSTRARGSRHRLCREPTVGRRPKKVAVNGGLR